MKYYQRIHTYCREINNSNWTQVPKPWLRRIIDEGVASTLPAFPPAMSPLDIQASVHRSNMGPSNESYQRIYVHVVPKDPICMFGLYCINAIAVFIR